jgi:hypothetical protein
MVFGMNFYEKLKTINEKYETGNTPLTTPELRDLKNMYEELEQHIGFLGPQFDLFKKEIRITSEKLGQYLENRNRK